MSNLEEMVENSLDRIRSLEPKEGYFLAFSGGKDSVCLKKLCDLAGVKYDAHYSVTSVDPPELVRFIKKTYPDVIFDYPRYSDGKRINMWNLIPKRKMPPTRLVRYCCSQLKETAGKGRLVLTGVRWAESTNRKKNQGLITIYDVTGIDLPEDYERTEKGGLVLNNDNDKSRDLLESCYRLKKTVINPIIDWSDEDVWNFIHQYNVDYCSLYDQGEKRLGCIGCPLSGSKRQKLDFAKYPKYKKAYLHAFEKMLEVREKAGLNTKWKTAEDVMRWWLREDRK